MKKNSYTIDINYIITSYSKNNINEYMYPIPESKNKLILFVQNLFRSGENIYLDFYLNTKIRGYEVIYFPKPNNEIIFDKNINIIEKEKIITLKILNNVNYIFKLRLILDYRDITWSEANFTWEDSLGGWEEQIELLLEV